MRQVDYTGGEWDAVFSDDGKDEIKVVTIAYCPLCSRSNSSVDYRLGTKPAESSDSEFVWIEELEAPCASHFL